MTFINSHDLIEKAPGVDASGATMSLGQLLECVTQAANYLGLLLSIDHLDLEQLSELLNDLRGILSTAYQSGEDLDIIFNMFERLSSHVSSLAFLPKMERTNHTFFFTSTS